MKAKIYVLMSFGFCGFYQSQIVLDSTQYKQLKDDLKEEVKKEISQTVKQDLENNHKRLLNWEKFSLRGYGVVNYYNFGKFDTDLSMKDKFDPERLNLYLEYQFNDKLSFKSEIEFEHGGTGATMEYDNQEEFGEIEQEIEKGGEVMLEQLNVNYKFSEAFNIRAGRLKVYFNSAQNLDSPASYFTTHRQEMEGTFIPLGWYENGIEFHGVINNKFRYYATITNGLDSSFFSSANFTKSGYQKRFEMQNTEAFAYMARLDYLFGSKKYSFAGISTYAGNTTPNRVKKDTNFDAWLNLVSAHFNYNENHLRVSAVGVYGNLQNSDRISAANVKLPNSLGAKRTPVAKNILGVSAEAGYEVLHLINPSYKQQLYPYFRYDFYDTMYKTSGDVVKKQRWEKSVFTGGINYFVHPQVVVKAQYSSRTLGSEHIDNVTVLPTGNKEKENYFSAGITFILN